MKENSRKKPTDIKMTSIICLTILGFVSIIGLFFGKDSLIGLSVSVGIVLCVVILGFFGDV
jgi:hypothetical protein